MNRSERMGVGVIPIALQDCVELGSEGDKKGG